jgi:cob(I)alamin adenosyltransferase
MPRIYTRTGDDGTTGRLYGGRIPKSDPATEAYGAVDEAVAALGVVRAQSDNAVLRAEILRIQRDLFVVGAELATNPAQRSKLEPGISVVTSEMVDRIEELIDRTVEQHPLPNEFVVPGASPISAALDVARGIVRRAERRAVTLRESGAEVSADLLKYLNRVSDLLFCFARWQAGTTEEPSRER